MPNRMSLKLLVYLLEYITKQIPSIATLFCSDLKTTLTCTVCKTARSVSASSLFRQVSASPYIQVSVNNMLSEEFLIDSNKVFCESCRCNQATNGKLVKDPSEVVCSNNISVPFLLDEEVSINKYYNLIATINHDSTLKHGHYTSYIKDNISTSWYHCNDRAVVKTNRLKIKKTNLRICLN